MKKRISLIVSSALLLLLAALLTAYPLIANYINDKYQSEVQTVYTEQMAKTDADVLTAAWEAAQEYNASLQPVQFEKPALQSAQENYSNLLALNDSGIMGYLEIPQIGAYLPIYHGTNEKTLENGIGHLVGSSLPVGGEGTHTVLTGHSGMATQRLLSDMDQMVVGDVFYLHVLNEILAYQVYEIHTVEPQDTSKLSIQKDADLCTLVTCTPFGVNTHRLLVQGKRTSDEIVLEDVEVENTAVPSTWQQQYYRGLLLGIVILVMAAALGSLYFISMHIWRKRHEKS